MTNYKTTLSFVALCPVRDICVCVEFATFERLSGMQRTSLDLLSRKKLKLASELTSIEFVSLLTLFRLVPRAP